MTKPIYELCRYQFTPAELRTLGDQLARETQDHFSLKEQRTTIASNFAARLKESGRRLGDLSTKINSGYEMREMECIVIFNKPQNGIKTIVRVDTGEEVRTEVMTDAETQGELFPAESAPVS